MARCLRLPGPAWSAWLLLLGCWLAVAAPARATHIVGGEMELIHQTGDSYTLLLNLYFDARNGMPGALDADLTASIFAKATNVRMTDVLLPLTSNTFINYTNPACTKPELSTRKLVYSKTITLPTTTYNSPQGYYVAVERCCRNRNISNIVAPEDAAQSFYLEFPAVVRNGRAFIDSTPRIFPPLSDYACLNELFYYDFGGQDADGDSLVYDVVTPFNGHSTPGLAKPPTAQPAPYSLITWKPGLSTLNQLPGAPTLSINRATGRLTVRPTDQGLFVFGVSCAEYRQGVKIGEARRDFQLMVLPCPINTRPSLVVLPAPTGQVPYRPDRDVLEFVPGGNRCVRLRFTDPDPNSRLSLSLSPVNFSGLLPNFTTTTTGVVHSPGAPDTLTATLCFPDCLNTQGRVFLLDVVVGDDGCSLPKRDTVRIAFRAVPAPNSPPTISTTAGPSLPLRVRLGDLVSFDVTGTDPDNDPMQLEMTGLRFNPADIGATLSQSPVGNQQRGRFTWRVDCRALSASPLTFQFAATATSSCGLRQSVTTTVPIIIDYDNRPPTISTTAASPLHVRIGELVSFDVTGTDPDNDPVQLEMTGLRFNPADIGATLSQGTSGNPQQGRFTWRVDCRALSASPLTFQFAAAAMPCGIRQSAITLVPIIIDYDNQAPALTSTLPAALSPSSVPVVELALGQSFTATFTGTDADRDGLTLTATGSSTNGQEGFDLASAGMYFEAQNGVGTATGTFRWDVSCAAAKLHRDLIVTFQLVDATCLPKPQTQRVQLKVQRPEDPPLTLYNVITPNDGDHLNKTFRLPDLPLDFCDERFDAIKIFSRWGQQVFESRNRDFQWPGLGSGGIYYYYVTYTDGRRYRGWLEVIP